MSKNLMVCSNSSKCLRLNEGETPMGGGKYILQGVFAELDKMNRNQRIYTKEEYLKHLQYLRDDIKKGEPLLGELDHPDDRFECKLKESSHRIIDLWYDPRENVVMGKIELLDTPNGKLAQSLVDQGIPLHISSRAAGTVNSDNTVSIQQIYTYDLVCKPGFAGAVLHRVNESAGGKYGSDAMAFLQKAEMRETENMAYSYGLLNESVSVSEAPFGVNLRKEAKQILENEKNTDNMRKPDRLFEDEEKEDDGFDNLFAAPDDDKDSEKKDDEKDGEKDDKKKDGVEILSIRGEFVDDEDSEKESDEDKDEDKDEDSDDDDDKEKDDEKKSEDSNECDGKDKPGKGKNLILDDNSEEMTKEQKQVLDKLDDLIKKAGEVKKESESCKDGACESLVMAQYPISMSLDEENFAQFAALSEGQKSKVVAYLQDRGIYEPKAINEMWKNGIDYSCSEPVWLKYAPSDYKALYKQAPANVQESLKNTAEYLLFESQRDVNVFWENSGLEQKAESHRKNRAFIDNMPKINESAGEERLPYGLEFIKAVADLACEYNK